MKALKKQKATAKTSRKPSAPLRQKPELTHRQQFDQLLDDAIFGVKNKKQGKP